MSEVSCLKSGINRCVTLFNIVELCDQLTNMKGGRISLRTSCAFFLCQPVI